MTLRLSILILLLSLGVCSACSQQRPRRASPAVGGVRVLRSGDDLQAAIDAARPGETITLEAGATFTGPVTLPAKEGAEYITIRTSVPDSELKPGVRVGPASARMMPKILAPGDGKPAIETAERAHHYRFIGIEFKTRDARAFSYNILHLGTESQKDLSQVPHHLSIDRCFIHSDGPSRRGVALNGAEIEILNSYISGFKEEGADSQAVCGWNGPGPYRIVNNYLEGAGENIMFGGSDPSIKDLVPADIEIRGNHLTKPVEWRRAPWVVKNLLELKNARRVTIEGNVLENNWAAGQSGAAVLLTPRNQDGGAPWTEVSDVVFRNNIVRHAVNAIVIMAQDYVHPSRPTHSIKISNNLFYDIDPVKWGTGSGGMFVMLTGRGASEIEISHNTAVHEGPGLDFEDGTGVSRLTVTGNILRYHILGSGLAGNDALARFTDGASVINNNAIVLSDKPDYWGPLYPPGNLFPESYQQVGFTNPGADDFTLKPGSPLKGRAKAKTDIGVNFQDLKTAGAFQAVTGTS